MSRFTSQWGPQGKLPCKKAQKPFLTIIGLLPLFRKQNCRFSPILYIMLKCYVNIIMLTYKARRLSHERENKMWYFLFFCYLYLEI